jgi:oligoendopeptidase F
VVDVTTIDQDTDLTAEGVEWDLEPLRAGHPSVDAMLDAVDALARELEQRGRGRIAAFDAGELADFYRRYAELLDLQGRAAQYAFLRFAADTGDPAHGALVARTNERGAQVASRLMFITLEWAAAPDDHVDAVLADPDPRLDFVRHHLRSSRRWAPHLLSEPEERLDTELRVVGASAWGRLYDELTSSLECPRADGTTVSLEVALADLQHPDRGRRQQAHESVSRGLAPGLRTRAFVLNTLLNHRAIQDRLRDYPSWVSSRNLANEASDESVQALVDAVVARYDIPQRWYALKARILGLEQLADYDRMASVATAPSAIGWSAATEVVLDSYSSFSPELAGIVQRFLREGWIDAPVRPGKRGGAFCAYTVPSHHPYVLLNWTGTTRDVSTLAHELGHGVHAYLAREQGIFQMTTPLTLAETASVFGETVTTNRLLASLDDPDQRLTLLAGTIDDSVATVFRQVAMNRFEHAVHVARREEGELSVDRFNELWVETQSAMLGDGVELTEGYRTWWSYIPHFIHTPFYVYAYAFGDCLVNSLYAVYQDAAPGFAEKYLDMLRAGGTKRHKELLAPFGLDASDPEFWDKGLGVIRGFVDELEGTA